MLLQYRHLVKRLLNVCELNAILIHDTLQTTLQLSYAVISEAPWQCASLDHDRLLQLTNGVKLPALVDLLQHGTQMA